jgi:sigma-B regulation protein RsbU (phosphoserine phosphatase)
MVTYSVPIHIESPDGLRFAGVVTCDIDLGWLDRTIANISLGKDGYGFLMSKNGTYISHPLKQIVFNESVFSIAEERGDPGLRRIGQGMISGVPGLIDFVSFARSEKSWLAWQPLKTADWIMGTIKSKEELRLSVLDLIRNEALVGLLGLTLLVIAVWLVAQSITGPVRELGKAAKTLASGDLEAELPIPHGRDEVAYLTKAFSAMRENLKRYIVDLAETTAAREKMNGELRIAHDIQMDLVPKTFPAFPNRDDMDLFAILDPAREVGGDFYDFFMLDQDHIVLAIGDVSGKGVPAALFMAVTRSFLRSEFRVEPDPGRTLSRVNDELSEGNDSCMFVTLFCAVVRLSDGYVHYANGGHNPPVRMCADGSLQWISTPHGPASGAMPGVEYATGNFLLNPGESILLYTDGVTEAMDPDKVLYGEDRLASCILGMGQPNCRNALGILMEDVRAHAAGAEQSDDITMLMFRWKSFSPEGGAQP